MIKAVKTDKGLHYFCGECGAKLDRVQSAFLFVDGVRHVMLRCPICFTLSSVGREDCAN